MLLSVEDLSVSLPDLEPYDGENAPDRIIHHVSFSLQEGEVLGIVGESGSGKSITALSVIQLLKDRSHIDSGRILFEGTDLTRQSEEYLCRLRGKEISMIFQEPMTSLDPFMHVGDQIALPLVNHTHLTKEKRKDLVIQSLEEVGLPAQMYRAYPHELSGGQRQRVMIAMAMINHPKLLIADEPTTALDVIVQRQILDLLKKLHQKTGTAILFISHDLRVISEICENVLVMFQGRVVEQGPVRSVLTHPRQEYTKTLVQHVPQIQTVPSDKPLLILSKYSVSYPSRTAAGIQGGSRKDEEIVHQVDLTVHEGEIVGIVGESGSGKSTLAKGIVGLARSSGKVICPDHFSVQMIFQDPYSSLNPSRTIEWTLQETIRTRDRVLGRPAKSKNEQKKEALLMLENVGLDQTFLPRYPRSLSGGQRQRVCIGQALLYEPQLLIADEAVTALDVTVSSQILKLLLSIHEKRHLSILFISHDIHIVKAMCHRILVMYQGRIVEQGTSGEITGHPQHPYTRKLIQAVL